MHCQHACEYMLNRLAHELDPRFTYHNLAHTTDVMAQCLRIAHAEGITDADQLALLKTAACYHDIGFLTVYDNHEAEGCRMAIDVLPRFAYSPAQIEIICRLIRATRIPQSPTDKLSEILCDADLDYLGRDDYKAISENLLAEWIAFDRIPDATMWVPIQRGFMEQHHYFTASNQRLRNGLKQQALARICEEA